MTPLGPLMVDLAGLALEPEERELLAHPLIGGLILFARNYQSPAQLRRLTAEVRALRDPPLLIAVDHEGGRVQRFRDGFTRIPPMRRFGELHESDPGRAVEAARSAGVVIGHELVSHGIDFSFTPVLDVDFGASSVIGDRAFSADPVAVGSLAGALVEGLAEAGVPGVGKHFPGHGFVRADSHLAVPVDDRSLAEIEAADLVPYRALIAAGLAGVMPAHVIYPAVDSLPAGFSRRWLREVLRSALGFRGVVFSDDLSMEGASVAGGIQERAQAALDAGCNMVLVCNAPESARALTPSLRAGPLEASLGESMRGRQRAAPQRYASALQTLGAALA